MLILATTAYGYLVRTNTGTYRRTFDEPMPLDDARALLAQLTRGETVYNQRIYTNAELTRFV